MNIKEYKVNVEENIYNYLTSDYIYLKVSNDGEIVVKDNDYIYLNDLVYISNTTKVYSTVSGKVLGLTSINNNKYLVIENDFKNKKKSNKGTKRYINKYTKEELLLLLNRFNIFNLDEKDKVLVINGLEDIYSDNYSLIIKDYVIQLLECIDAIIEILNIKKCFFVIDSSKNIEVNTLINNIGTYPKISLKLMNYYYPLHKKEVLLNKIIVNSKYEVGYLNVKDVYNIYNIMKKTQPVIENFITITGNLIDFSKVYRVKVGTNLVDLINELSINKLDNVIINGMLTGIKLKDLNFIIDNTVNSIIISKCTKYYQIECINCGICISNCPVQINPKYMYFNNDKKSKEYKEKCIDCGLCSFLCPSKIDLNKGVKNENIN